MTKRRVRGRLVVTRAGEGFVARLPVEARDTLVVSGCNPSGNVFHENT